jgi:hypothetical protein
MAKPSTTELRVDGLTWFPLTHNNKVLECSETIKMDLICELQIEDTVERINRTRVQGFPHQLSVLKMHKGC